MMIKSKNLLPPQLWEHNIIIFNKSFISCMEIEITIRTWLEYWWWWYILFLYIQATGGERGRAAESLRHHRGGGGQGGGAVHLAGLHPLRQDIPRVLADSSQLKMEPGMSMIISQINQLSLKSKMIISVSSQLTLYVATKMGAMIERASTAWLRHFSLLTVQHC